ncbi:hypothetical protein C8R47DRAFT_1322477 [Mycena vitilis]|nr:hypothetical protein C8R47DRAFT_1322477 [Mycena vitilis]
MNYTSPPLQYNIPPLPSKHIYSPSLEYLEELGELPDWILAHVKSAVPKVIPIQGKDSENNFLPNTRFYPSLDFVPFKEWVQTPIPKNSQLSKDWETGDWEAWAGLHRMYTLPWTLSRSVVGMHIREKYGIGGRILPVAHRSEYGSHNMVFTTTKDNFYYISVGIDKIHVLGKFKSVDYFLEHGAIRGPELPEVEERDKFAHNVSVRQRHLLAAFVRVGGDPKNIVAAMIAGKQWWEVFAHDTRLKPLLTPFGGLMAYEQVILKDADCVPPSDYMKKNPM